MFLKSDKKHVFKMFLSLTSMFLQLWIKQRSTANAAKMFVGPLRTLTFRFTDDVMFLSHWLVYITIHNLEVYRL